MPFFEIRRATEQSLPRQTSLNITSVGYATDHSVRTLSIERVSKRRREDITRGLTTR